MELERPSVSYIIDVCSTIQLHVKYDCNINEHASWIQLIWWFRCFHQQLNLIDLRTPYLPGICTHH